TSTLSFATTSRSSGGSRAARYAPPRRRPARRRRRLEGCTVTRNVSWGAFVHNPTRTILTPLFGLASVGWPHMVAPSIRFEPIALKLAKHVALDELLPLPALDEAREARA